MIIFIGGMKPHHQQNFIAEFPEVSFTFACYDDTDTTWVKEARKADIVLVDQSRCKHDIIDAFRRRGIKPYFTDSKVQLRAMVRDCIVHGQPRHRYSHVMDAVGYGGGCMNSGRGGGGGAGPVQVFTIPQGANQLWGAGGGGGGGGGGVAQAAQANAPSRPEPDPMQMHILLLQLYKNRLIRLLMPTIMRHEIEVILYGEVQ